MDSPLAQSNLVALLADNAETGPLWSTESEDLDCTFVAWNEGQGVAVHRNSEVDVAMIVVAGEGEVTIGGETLTVTTGQVVLIPKDVERAVRATGGRFAYLNVHKRRRRLMPGKMADRSSFGLPPRSAPF